MKFNAIIEQLIQETQTNTEQGKKFEILIKKILQVVVLTNSCKLIVFCKKNLILKKCIYGMNLAINFI